MISAEQRLAAIAELQRRLDAKANAPEFADDAFPQQAAFIRDTHRLLAALCPRRAGKTQAAGRKLLRVATRREQARCLYVALTIGHARDLMWPVLKMLDALYELNAHFHESRLEMTLPNGAVIKLTGADQDPQQMRKLLGQAYDIVVLDEAGSFRIDLADLVYNVLRPAMMDHGGVIVLIGTPEGVHGRTNLFYRVTTGDREPTDPLWHVHKWSSLENPYMREQVQAELDEIDRTRPLYRETKGFKAMFLGLWTLDDDDLVYKFNAERNLYRDLPPGDYELVLGVDMGFNDDAAFVIFAWRPNDYHLYLLESFKKPKLDVTAHANAIHQICRRYDITRVVVDGSNKVAVEEMRKRHGLAGLEAAQKRGKFEHIDLLNDDLVAAKILIHEDNAQLIEEMAGLVIDKKALQRTRKRVEHPGCPNHLCDAMLYAWRASYSYHALPETNAPRPDTADWFEAEADKMEREKELSFAAARDPFNPAYAREPDWSMM